MKSSTYYFHVKRKILTDFQICISVPSKIQKNTSTFLIKLLKKRLFIKKETLSQVFSYEFCEISKKTFLQNTSGRLLLKVSFFNMYISNGHFFKGFQVSSFQSIFLLANYTILFTYIQFKIKTFLY